MPITRDSGSGAGCPTSLGLIDDEIRELISIEVIAVVRGSIPKVFVSIKTMMIELFDERYVAVTEAVIGVATTVIVIVGVQWRGSF